MKTRLHWALAFLAFWGVHDPADLPAVPREVTFFPQSARVVDVARLTLQPAGSGTLRAVAVLPSQTLTDSLTARLPADSPLRIEDQSWRQIERQEDARIADLQRQIQALRTERIGIFSHIQALETEIQFWQAQAKGKARTLEEATATAALLNKQLRKALQEKLALEPTLERTDKRLRELQEDLNRISGLKETRWEVTFLLSGPPARDTTLTLDYSLSGCGWTPLYRLEASPRENAVHFGWEAEFWQGSGLDWSDIMVSLATLPPRSAIAPPELPPWIVRPRPAAVVKGRLMVEGVAAPSAAASMLAEAPDAGPREARQSTYAVWQIGKRNIPAGSRQRVKVLGESWPADFVRLLRPGQTHQSFVQAHVTLTESREIPPGQATFLIDGAILGKRPFSFAGREATLSFGTDPLVNCEVTQLSRRAGEKGFITDRQTHEWSWRYQVQNSRDSAVRIRLEDAVPQTRDEKIRVTLKTVPEPAEKNSEKVVWTFGLAPGDTQSVLNTILIDAPREMELDLGSRH
jgi:uncharacterized protein (TIGR02231 family)